MTQQERLLKHRVALQSSEEAIYALHILVSAELCDHFELYGTVSSARLASNSAGRRRGFRKYCSIL